MKYVHLDISNKKRGILTFSAVSDLLISRGESISLLSLSVIRTKLNKPPVSTFHVPRESILESLQLDRHKPLTLVSAPAGYGKTETISSWLDRYNHSYGWISLSKDENDLRLFLTYLAYSLLEFAPCSSKKIQETVSAMKLPSVKQLVEDIINELDEIDEPFFLILDDYHKITNWAIHEFIDLIVLFPPENMSLVLLTRRDPGLQLHLYRAYGKIHEIRMHDLSFSREETKKMMGRLFERNIEEETIRHLHLQTEGWITGIQLATLLTKQEPDPNQSLRNISTQPHVLTEFLKLEILDRLSEPFQHLLLLLSVPDRFNASLIDALISNLDSRFKPDSTGAGFFELASRIESIHKRIGQSGRMVQIPPSLSGSVAKSTQNFIRFRTRSGHYEENKHLV